MAKEHRYDHVIVGMGSAGLVGAEFAAALGLHVAVVERHRVGGDCLWTGCVPPKPLLSSAKVAHRLRTAGRFGIDPVEPAVDRRAVWARIRPVQGRIVTTDDDPERYRAEAAFEGARRLRWLVRQKRHDHEAAAG